MIERPPEFRRYVEILRRQVWLVAVVVSLALVAATAVTLIQTPIYRASMSVVVGQGGGIFQPQFGGTVQPFVETMANLFTTDVVPSTTISDLRLHTAPNQLLANTQVSTTPDSSVITVTYDSPSPTEAVRVLAEMGNVFTTTINQKLGTPGSSGTPITATVFDPAHLEPGKVSPQPAQNLGFAAVIGLVVGLALAFTREGLDNRIRTERDAEHWFGVPVLGSLPGSVHAGADLKNAGLRLSDGGLPQDPMRMVRQSLRYAGGELGAQVTAITTADARDPKTTLACVLGLALAGSGSRVICVEADLRHPGLGRALSLKPPRRGLVDVLAGRTELDDALIELPARRRRAGRPARATRTSAGGSDEIEAAGLGELGNHGTPAQSKNGRSGSSGGLLQILPAGKTRGDADELPTGSRVKQLVDALRTRADYIILDAPPITDAGDGLLFARAADDVIVVATEGTTTHADAATARATLERLDVDGVGVVFVNAGSQGSERRAQRGRASGAARSAR